MPYTDLVRLLSVIVPALFERPAQGTDVILALRQQKQERNSRKRPFSEQCFMIAALWRKEANGGEKRRQDACSLHGKKHAKRPADEAVPAA
jgi:hypothetical protein